MNEIKSEAGISPVLSTDGLCLGGYWCVVCGRHLPEKGGVIVHDPVPHPKEMTIDEE